VTRARDRVFGEIAKQKQVKPNKTKEKDLDFLGFLWPN
jgi:hypothetical protein